MTKRMSEEQLAAQVAVDMALSALQGLKALNRAIRVAVPCTVTEVGAAHHLNRSLSAGEREVVSALRSLWGDFEDFDRENRRTMTEVRRVIRELRKRFGTSAPGKGRPTSTDWGHILESLSVPKKVN